MLNINSLQYQWMKKRKIYLALIIRRKWIFFLKSEQYYGFELPEYFVFDELLQNLKETVGDALYAECL